ncbi:hypothetical protein BDZ90DRAFT_20973 [Jaminaea rosea]|uniref:Uncharacterized protein n=1 Tax=Jaminaea rosea TaxID=1569628 RepID=A0A316V122_9BASI|nr:hypothetical protein BDZ90DRAFT_20973 [Jaminaea rosea]PWN30698.1 hypothetical protein BDZ90DRAFT_20973 [Jaminaea rosea]
MPCIEGCTEGSHTCHFPNSQHVHLRDKLIQCADMFGKHCAAHVVWVRLQSFKSSISSTWRMRSAEKMAAYDTARMTKGEAIKVMERLGELKSSMYRAVLPGEWDYETIETILRSNATSAEQTAMLCEVCPLGEHLDLQQSSPTPRTVPFGVEALASRSIFKASIDLWQQYDLRTGKPIGHLFDACRRLPNWLQMSKASGLGFVTIAIKVQMSLHALDDATTRPLTDRLSSLITASRRPTRSTDRERLPS